jgi:hypothetical protein
MSRLDIRNTALCFLICAAAFLLVDPIAEMPFQDDWSYAFSARQCAATGHLTYNGWSTAIILPHVYWGALWIRLFGFSFTVLRLSTLPLAAGSVALAYLLARQADLRPSAAFFVAMLLAFSPLFLPVATSYMVDVPGLFFMLASLCALVHAVRSDSWAWIFVGAGLGMIGGMSRQIGWIVPLALLPYFALVRCRTVGFLLCAAAAWVIVIVDVVWSMRWFAHQPLALQDSTLIRSLDALHNPIRTFIRLVPLGLTLMLVILPAALPAVSGAAKELWRRRAGRGGAAAAVVCAQLAIFLLRNPRFGLEPWMPITITTQGVMDGLELSGHRPESQPLIVRGIFSAAVLLAIAMLASSAVMRARWSWTSVRDFWFPRAGHIAAPALLLFASAYTALLVPRADQNWLTDRYAIPLIPVLAIFLLRRGSEGRPNVAWVLLVFYALYTLASTQDLLALERARGHAVRRLSDAVVAPTAIAAGFEYDGWAELLATGYINDYRIPPALFKPDVGMTPSLRPLYRLEFERQSDTIPSSFGAVDYFSALPPFHRRIFIDRFRRPWWTDPQQLQSAGHPPPMSYESYYDSN